jgi:hypothetical protein
MFVTYLRVKDENYDYEIMARRSRHHLLSLFSNESMWIVLGNVSTDY